MNRIKTLNPILAAALLYLLSCYPTHAASPEKPSAEAQIAALEDGYIYAVAVGSVMFAEEHLDADYFGTGTDGSTHDKAVLIERRKSTTKKYTMVKTLDRKIRVLGDTALVWQTVKLAGQDKGGSFDQRTQLTRVWQRLDGQWKVVAFHTTRIADTPPLE